MVEFWVPAVGDLIKRKDSDLQGKIVSYKAFENNAVAYVCGSTGCHHLSINVHEWQLDHKYIHPLKHEYGHHIKALSLEKEEITKPERYNKKGKLECWDVILDQEMDFLEGNIVKYVWRYKEKNGVEDLKKARVYLDKLISKEEKK